LPENGQDSEQLPSVKKMSSARRFCKRDSGQLLPTPQAGDYRNKDYDIRTSNLPNRLKGTGRYQSSSQKSETSMERNGEVQLSLQGVSPASLSLMPGRKEARRMTVTSGRKCLGLLRKQDPTGCLLRMCLESSEWHSTRCLLIWKAKVTPQGRLLFQLVASTPRIEGIGSGLLLTPASCDGEGGTNLRPGRESMRLRDQVPILLAIPMGQEPGNKPKTYTKGILRRASGKSDFGMCLTQQIAMLPTPQEDDSSNVYPNEKRRETLVKVINGTSGKKTGMKLQPIFCEWMMGFSAGFTCIEKE